jgi:two-component system alkaline phosphatase synthesis response regulator PhoP
MHPLPRILVIDDDPEIQSMLSTMLSAHGFSVCAAEDGASALKLIESDHFDLLITDIRLPPPLDGIETVRLARKKAPHLRSLFMSGSCAPQWDNPNCDDFVSKPFTGRELVGCILELFLRDAPATQRAAD